MRQRLKPCVAAPIPNSYWRGDYLDQLGQVQIGRRWPSRVTAGNVFTGVLNRGPVFPQVQSDQNR
jgi:hypothetical protein